MSGINGPGGPTSPGGPTGVTDNAAADGAAAADSSAQSSATNFAEQVRNASAEALAASTTNAPSSVDTLAAEISAGRMTPNQAIDVLLDQAAGPDLPVQQRAQLRELLTDMLANDPHFAELTRRVGG